MNILLDPGFEVGAPAWTLTGPGTALVSTPIHGGLKALRIRANRGFGGNYGGSATQALTTVVGAEYPVQAWCYPPSSGAVALRAEVDLAGTGGNFQLVGLVVPTDLVAGQYNLHGFGTFLATAPLPGLLTQFRFRIATPTSGSGQWNWYVDDAAVGLLSMKQRAIRDAIAAKVAALSEFSSGRVVTTPQVERELTLYPTCEVLYGTTESQAATYGDNQIETVHRFGVRVHGGGDPGTAQDQVSDWLAAVKNGLEARQGDGTFLGLAYVEDVTLQGWGPVGETADEVAGQGSSWQGELEVKTIYARGAA